MIYDGLMGTTHEAVKNAIEFAIEKKDCRDAWSDYDGNCLQACTKVIEYLAKNHSHSFDRMLLLKSHSVDNEPHTNFKISEWSYHVWFLLKDAKDGRWIAGSPANLYLFKNPSEALQTIQSMDLSELISQIQERDGGIWPSAIEIEKAEYMAPVLKTQKVSVITTVALHEARGTYTTHDA